MYYIITIIEYLIIEFLLPVKYIISTLNIDHSPHAHSRDVFLCYKCLYRGQFYAESAEAKTE